MLGTSKPLSVCCAAQGVAVEKNMKSLNNLKIAYETKAKKYKRKYKRCKQHLQSLTKMCQSGVNCAICVDLLAVPHALECGHLFCFTCIVEWVRNCCSDDIVSETDEFENLNIRKDLTCPLCRCGIRKPPTYAKSIELQISSSLDLILLSKKARDQYKERNESEKSNYQKETCQETVAIWEQYISSHATGIVDLNDGVSRCVHCLWEIVEGYCTNCELHYKNNTCTDDVETESDVHESDIDDKYLDTEDDDEDPSEKMGYFIDDMALDDLDSTDDESQQTIKRQRTIRIADDSETE